MFSIYDLYDLSAVYKNIRMYPCYELNSIILDRILNLLYKHNEHSELNQIRKALRSISGLDNDMYRFAYIDNYYTYFPSLLKDDHVYSILIECTEELLDVFTNGNKKQIFELADCLHNLPIDIVENKFQIPGNFWKFEVPTYRNNWDKSFLYRRNRHKWCIK